MSDFLTRVSAVQAELKAPKGQYNSFGKYKYRSCEDILEAVKPLLHKHRLVLTVSDEVIHLGERYYIKARATLFDTESDAQITNTALARESPEKKGMDDSQITGTASSYARKYALNGLFCIDDTKDADTDEYKAGEKKREYPEDAAFAPLCSECGNEVTGIEGRDGKAWTPKDVADYSLGKYGRIICAACQKKAKA